MMHEGKGQPRLATLNELVDEASANATAVGSVVAPTGTYATYMKATIEFRDGMAKLLPKKFRLQSVDDFKRAADWILEKSANVADHLQKGRQPGQNQKTKTRNHNRLQQQSKHRNGQDFFSKLDPLLLKYLDVGIRLRQEQARKHRDSCSGHEYILRVMQYCRDVLCFCKKIVSCLVENQTLKGPAKELTATAPGDLSVAQRQSWTLTSPRRTSAQPQDVWELCDITNLPHNRRTMDKEEENFTDSLSKENASSLRSNTLSLPISPSGLGCDSHAKGGSGDFVNADDRFQCIAFLSTMDRLVGVVRDRFDRVKELCILHPGLRNDGVDNQDDAVLLHHLMEASIATNLCMECVRSTWAQLSLEHPHIRTIYDLIALVFVFPEIDSSKYPELFAHDSIRYPHLLFHLVSDILESCFSLEEGMDASKAVQGYLLKAGLPDGGWEKELLLEETERLVPEVCAMMLEPRTGKIRTHILQGYKFIGGDVRCILNTQNVLQQVFSFLHPRMKSTKNCEDATLALAKAAQDRFYFAWHEDKHPARRIRVDLDRLLASHLLPELINACSAGYQKYPICANVYVARFLPIIQSLDIYLNKDLGGPVPVHITFGFHCMLVAIMALQGNRHMQGLGTKVQGTIQHHYRKMNQSMKDLVTDGDNEDEDVKNFFQYWKILMPTWPPTLSKTSRFIAYWNPLMAGSFCLYSAYNGLQIGALVSGHQMSRVLHIYNAMRCRELLEPIEILDLFDSIFAEAQGIWATGAKCKNTGDFLKSYLLGVGMTVRDAALFRTFARKKFSNGKCRMRNYFDDKKTYLSFKPDCYLEARQFSRGTNILLYRKFSDIDMAKMRSTRADVEDDTECEVLIAVACQALKDDLTLFGGGFLNWLSVGHALKKFEVFLESNTEKADLKDLADDGFTYPDDLLGELDFCSKANLQHAPRYGRLFKEYFKDIKRDKFVFSGAL